MKYKILFTVIITLNIITPNVMAAKIIATVGSDVITDYEVRERTRFFLWVNKDKAINDNAAIDELIPAMTAQLIEEYIRNNYAHAIKLSIDDNHLDRYIENLEKFKKLPPGRLRKALKRQNIPYTYALSALRNDAIWSIIVNNVVASSVKVSNEEIEQRIEMIHPVISDGVEIDRSKIRETIFKEKLNIAISKLTATLHGIYFVEMRK